MQVELDKGQFQTRLKRVLEGWNDAAQENEWSSIEGCDALFLPSGDPSGEDEPMKKGTCFQQWLLGYEFPSTILLFEKDRLSILCSSSKAKYLSQLKDPKGIIPVEIFAQAKAKEPVNDSLPKFVERYLATKKVGTMLKEQQAGKIMKEWAEALKTNGGAQPETVDMGPAVSSFMAVKDAEELKATQIAASLTLTLLKHGVLPRLETILDRELKITHDTLAAQFENKLGSGDGQKGPDMKIWSNYKGKMTDADWGLCEFAYSPIIISKSSKTYDLRYTGESTEDNISHKGAIVVAFGLRYKSYSANVARTFIVDPTPSQEAQYNLLIELQAELLRYIKEGVLTRDVYQHAVSFISQKMPDLEKNFVKNIGFGTGVEFRDASYLLSSKNNRTIHKDMVFVLGIGFNDVVDAKGNKYLIHIADTIHVGEDGARVLTEGVKNPKMTLFSLNQEDPEDRPRKERAPPPKSKKSSPVKKTAGTKVLRGGATRRTQDEVHQTAAAKLREHQQELHEKLQTAGSEKYSEDGDGKKADDGPRWKKFQSYKGEIALPSEVDKLRIYVDKKAQTVILPIHGFMVPFHVHTIKNISKSDEGEFTLLRVNFQTPGQLVSKKEDTPFEDPDATFIRSISYRSPDGNRFDSVAKQITDLKKEVNKREQQKKEMADVVDQDNLIEIKGRRPIKLPELMIRPALDGKRNLPGEVEIHSNGIRYHSAGSQRVDILFANIKHLFFQPCDHELMVIIHIHLKAPIMLGKRKTFDIQFFREASDVAFDETGNRKRKARYGDEDEIEMEQQDRRHRQTLNKEIKAFSEKIAEAASQEADEPIELDIPFRELSFEGVPHRTAVRMQPTTDCLVHLVEPPFLVVTLNEIEIASLERVQYGLRQFDLVLIFKDYSKAPLHINSIDTKQIDDVKNWLDSVDIAMAEGPVNLNWGPIMKHINESPHEFFQTGGWSFLRSGNDAADESESEESESDFQMDDDEDAEEDEASDEESDYSEASDGSSGSGSFDESDEADDWDELERKAAKSDAKKVDEQRSGRHGDDSDDDRPKKKAPNGKSNGKSNGKPTNGKGKPQPSKKR
ncbi:FACT complex subunit SPT16 [Cylindrobasidium torrendii FP15055 ss-10]|uniref:FACT complex subunit n=1 Tax=Cylindrobasidium torrendii FP15055 ss-10 TaxID=1314674 RepID=A0A0D7AVX7_9AGAR|nr:FACT complex subunit SPT16 [Cylindrobasidium torrendii FP15055 ss-10]